MKSFTGHRVLAGAVPAVNLQPRTSKILVEKVFSRFARGEFGEVNWIYYPYSNLDISPSSLFNDVLYIDNNPEVVSTLRRAGLKAYMANILEYDPQRKTDLLVLTNPVLNEDNTRELIEKVNPNLILAEISNPTTRNIRKIKSLEFQTNLNERYQVFRYSG